jgi:hypothetical protein
MLVNAPTLSVGAFSLSHIARHVADHHYRARVVDTSFRA